MSTKAWVELERSKNAKSASLTDFWWGMRLKNFVGVLQIPIFAFFFAGTILDRNPPIPAHLSATKPNQSLCGMITPLLAQDHSYTKAANRGNRSNTSKLNK